MKKRIDETLVERGLAADVKEAVALVMAGEVLLGDHRVEKPGTMVPADAQISLKNRSKYVSRGGDKLASVMDRLKLDFEGKTVLDVGASTGGFTDVALQNGAAKVWCIDVGTAQLSYKLRQDRRVVVMEQTDIRELALRQAQGVNSGLVESQINADMAVVDLSFIKLEKVLSSVASLVRPRGLIVAMMKPQFEADKVTADQFKGVISDEAVRQAIIADFRDQIREQFEVLAEADSLVLGSKGNKERFFVLSSSTSADGSRDR